MSSVKSVSSDTGQEDIVKMCYLKKLKTNKKKFFVLRKESGEAPARLEYYDTEKNFKKGNPPKRTIELKRCFNINKKADTRVKNCLALYTKDDCFCVVLESPEEANEWLKSLLELQHGGATESGEIPKPTFEFVWQVKVQEKGLGATYNILGLYSVCLTTKSLSLIKMGCKDDAEEKRHTYDFSLASIRRCGSSQCFFYMEVGRSSVTGAGELWMVTDDQHIASHMHQAILTAMKSSSNAAAAAAAAAGIGTPTGFAIKSGATPPTNYELESEITPKPRTRSSSYNETTRPVLIQRRQTHGNDTMLGFISGMTGNNILLSSTTASTTSISTTGTTLSSVTSEHPLLGASVSVGSTPATICRDRCDSMPCAPRTRTTSEGYTCPVHHPRVLSGYGHAQHVHCSSVHNYLSPGVRPHSMCIGRGISHSPPIDCSPVSPVSGGCSTEDSAGSSLSIDDPDGSSIPWFESATQEHINRSLTESFVGSTPPSRYSNALDNCRYSGGQLLSPDDSIPGSILEENGPDYIPWGSHISEEDQEYMQMEKDNTENLSIPLNNNKYQTNSGSPNQSSYMDMSSPIGSSPQDMSPYMIMSPSADITPQAITIPPPFPRSPGMAIKGAGSSGHSRASSLAEDVEFGYVAMAHNSHPRGDDGYVDMALDHSRGESLGGSSCSLTSGTASMTHPNDRNNQFSSEYHLEKVASYFTPSEDEDDLATKNNHNNTELRTTRAYSLGSRPENRRQRTQQQQQQQQQDVCLPQVQRARALSMGAQQRPNISRSPLRQLRHSPIMNNVLRASDNLSSSWSGGSNNATKNLMELDLSSNSKNNRTSSSDYLEMDFSDKLHNTSSPIMEESVELTNNKTAAINTNSGGNNSDDYLNMSCGSTRRSQPINIANNQSASKTSTSPNMFSLPGFFSRKNSNSTGTSPKVHPETPSPFSSLQRRGKKKGKDKRNSMSSDDASNATTPVGMFPFSPGTPSKSFVPEEQFARCSVDASSGALCVASDDDSSNAKRKISSALKPPLLGQAGGRTVVVDPINIPPRVRNSASESEYVPMHPTRRKFSDINSSESGGLEKSRKSVSDNVLLDTCEFSLIDYTPIKVVKAGTPKSFEDYALIHQTGIDSTPTNTEAVESDYAYIIPEASGNMSQDYALMSMGIANTPPKIISKPPEHANTTATRLIDQNTTEDYMPMSFSPKQTLEPVKEQVTPTPSNVDPGDYAVLSVGSLKTNTAPKVYDELATDYALMILGNGTTGPRLIETENEIDPEETPKVEEKPSEFADYALMTPGDSKIEYESNFKCVQPLNPSDLGEYAVLAPPNNDDYALMLGGKVLEDKNLKDKQNIAQQKLVDGKLNVTNEVRKTPSPLKEETDDYVLMTPAIKPPLLPRASPLSLHLNNPTVVPSKVTSLVSQVPESSVPATKSTPIHIPKSTKGNNKTTVSRQNSSGRNNKGSFRGGKPANNKQQQQQQQQQSSNNKQQQQQQSSNNKQQQQKSNNNNVRRSVSKSPQSEINYASLDLPPLTQELTSNINTEDSSTTTATTITTTAVNTNTLVRNLSSDSSGDSDVTSVGTTYAQIDFVKTQKQCKK